MALPAPHPAAPPPPPLSSLEQLRARMAAVVAPPGGSAPPWRTGVGGVDRLLGGGIPRGRLTQVVGPRGAGKSTLLRGVVAEVLRGGGWVAWVDAQRTLAPGPWSALGARLIVVRPPTPHRSAWAADQLLRSGVFALVVLDGAPALSRVQGVRLAQLARDRHLACVLLMHEPSNSHHSATNAMMARSKLFGALVVQVDVGGRVVPPSVR
ncbi:MAG: hypothetical protein KJT01_16940, partial [Gemmatimonadetes bacterium]|nr:hypothetical protein [Gemmatimonadota bacterium]